MHLLVRETKGLDEADAAIDLRHSPRRPCLPVFFRQRPRRRRCCMDSAPRSGSLLAPRQSRQAPPPDVGRSLRRASDCRSAAAWSSACLAGSIIGATAPRSWPTPPAPRASRWRCCRAMAATMRGSPKLSTVGRAMLTRLDGYFAEGGPDNMTPQGARSHGPSGGPRTRPWPPAEPFAMHGVHELGVADIPGRPLAVIVFYRAYLLAADLAPIEALARALGKGPQCPRALCRQLEGPRQRGLRRIDLARLEPEIVLNATAFSARLDDAPSPLEAAGAPVLQLVWLAPSQDAWAMHRRGGCRKRILPCRWRCPSSMAGCLPRRSPSRPSRARSTGLEFARVAHAAGERWHRGRCANVPALGRGSAPRRARCAGSRLSCPTIRVRPGKRRMLLASMPSPAPAKSCDLLKTKASTSAERFPANEALSPSFATPTLRPFLPIGDYRRLLGGLDPDASAKIDRDVGRTGTADPRHARRLISPCASPVMAS